MTKTKTAAAQAVLALSVVSLFWLQYQTGQNLRTHKNAVALELEERKAARSADAEKIAGLQRETGELRSIRTELAGVRAEITRLRAERGVAGASKTEESQSVPASPQEQTQIGSETEKAAFMAASATEKGLILGNLRRAMIARNLQSGDFLHLLELAKTVRPKLEALESHPAEFADFQTEFVKGVIDLKDEAKVAQLREIIESTYEQAVAGGLESASRPVGESEVEDWGQKRDKLDRGATRQVQELLSEDERARFDRYFLGIMGIDLGINDGAMHRFTEDDGTVIFPSN